MVRDVSPDDSCRGNGFLGAWRLAVHIPRQVVWKLVSPGSSRAAPGDNAKARLGYFMFWMCVVYKALVISRRSTCWCFLSCGSERIP